MLPVTTTVAVTAAVTTAAVTTAGVTTATAAMAATPSAVTMVVIIAAGGEQGGTQARNRLGSCLGQQGRGRFLAALPVTGHPGRDEPGHDRGGERCPAPLRHPEEVSYLAGERRDLAGERAGGERVDEILAGRVHVDRAAEVAEVRAAAPVT